MVEKNPAVADRVGEGIENKQPLSNPSDSTAQDITTIPLSLIRDGGAQMREAMSLETVNSYAEDMQNGATFPPINCYFDGTYYWLGDGFHRVEAARKIDRTDILADAKPGTARDALLHGVSANAAHGLRRTQADKRRAVVTLLRDPGWAKWSDRKIAAAARVDNKTVGKIRRELGEEILTGKSLSEEILKPSGKPTRSGSLVADLLRTASDEQLIDECRRRGLEVSASFENEEAA